METLHEPDAQAVARLIAHRPFPELATALRSQADQIVKTWMGAARAAFPAATDLLAVELRDHLPAILAKMADVLSSASKHDLDELIRHAPIHGLARFEQRFDVRELMMEDRLLRRVIIEQVEVALGRRMLQGEQVALDMGIDTMFQEAVIAFIAKQNNKLRTATEAVLACLSFLSHDLSNNLVAIQTHLDPLRRRLAARTNHVQDVETLDAAQQSIADTIAGLEHLLQGELLRKAESSMDLRFSDPRTSAK